MNEKPTTGRESHFFSCCTRPTRCCHTHKSAMLGAETGLQMFVTKLRTKQNIREKKRSHFNKALSKLPQARLISDWALTHRVFSKKTVSAEYRRSGTFGINPL